MTTTLGLLAVAAATGAGAWFGHPSIVLLGALVTAVGVVGRLWSGLSLVGVRTTRTLSRDRAFAGDVVELSLRAENRKLLPLAWMRLDEQLPRALVPVLAQDARAGGIGFSTPLRGYQSVTRHCLVACTRRGFHAVGPTLVRSGDAFGLFERRRFGPPASRLIVYPRLVDVEEFGLPSRFPLGDARDPSRLFEDANRPDGVRDYTCDTPFKAIAWSASARQGRLQAKTFDATTSLRVAIFLAVDSFAGNDAEAVFELAVSAAAAIGRRLMDGRHPVGLYANGSGGGRAERIAIAPGRGEDQERAMLEALAGVERPATMPFTEFLAGSADALAGRVTLCVIAAGMSEQTISHLADLQRRGNPVTVLVAGSGPLPIGAFASRRLSVPEPRR